MEEDRVIENGFLAVEDDRIAAVGKMELLADGAGDAIDLQGADLYPGFVDAHTHLGMWEDSIGFEGDDGNEDTDPCTPQLRGIDAINPVDRCFDEAVHAGVTTVLSGPGSSNPIAGQIAAISTYGRRIDDMILAAPIAMKFALGENPKNTYHSKSQAPVTRMATAALIREQLNRAQRYAEEMRRAEADPDYDRPEFDFKCEALLPLLDQKIKAHFHAHRADDIFTAMRIAEEFHLDYVIVHGTNAHKFADILSENDVPVLCGPVICDRSKPELAELSTAAVGLLARAGVRTAIITDHPETPIQYLPLCASLAVRNGMEQTEALKAITIHPAEICGIDHLVGSVRAGKRADLTVFERGSDPLGLENRPKLVVVGGKIAVK